MRQHAEAHRRELATHQALARKSSAAQFRLQWESQEPATTAEVDNDDDSISALSKPGAVEGALQRTATPGCKPRPFLRRKWLDHFDKSSGTSCTGSDFTVGEGPPRQTDKRAVVTRDHLRGVIQLVLSDARANAFVVVSCLDGLLLVASESAEKGRDGGPGSVSAKVTEAVNGSSTVAENGLFSDNSSAVAGSSSAPTGLDNKTTRTFDGATTTDKRVSGADNSYAASVETLSPACARASVVGHDSIAATTGWSTTASQSRGAVDIAPRRASESDGASLCVQLGALPAVLGCLRQHAGHSRIEPKGVALLYLFARDSATRNAVQGNIDVLEACASRMHPVAPLRSSAHTDASLANSPAETNSARKRGLIGDRDPDLTSDGDITECRRPENPIASLQNNNLSRAASKGGKMDDACYSSTSVTPVVGESARNERAPMVISVSTGVDTGSPRPLVEAVNARSATAAPNAAPPAEEEEEDTAFRQLPASDLVFVLSVALQGSPDCQGLAVRQGGIAAMLTTLGCLTRSGNGDSGSNARLAETCLRVLEHLGERGEGKKRLVKEGCVDVAIATIGRFR